MKRESRFVIHQFINNGYHIILDVNSSSVHVVDPVVHDAAAVVSELVPEMGKPEPLSSKIRSDVFDRLWSKCTPEELGEALEDIEELIAIEQLLTKDIYRGFVVDFRQRKTAVKALCLHIAHNCGLACRYCFAEEGEYHGRRALMSCEVGKKALDFLIAGSGSRERLKADFFGGEPPMNRGMVKYLVECGHFQEAEHHKRFRPTTTTDGALLNDEIIGFYNGEMSDVVMSLDGRKDINDKMHPFRNGSGSYDLTVPKFQKFAKSRGQKDYYMRGTLTGDNLDFVEDMLHYTDLGFEQMSMEPVVSDPAEDYSIRREDLPAILKEYDRPTLEYIKRKKEGGGFNFFYFMLDLKADPCVAERMAGCGPGTEYLVVTPRGDFYPRHQLAGGEEFLMGNVDTGVVSTDIRDGFKTCNVYAKEGCKDCFARFYCNDGCSANACNSNGSINGAYEIGCEMQKERIECAIMIKAALADEEAE